MVFQSINNRCLLTKYVFRRFQRSADISQNGYIKITVTFRGRVKGVGEPYIRLSSFYFHLTDTNSVEPRGKLPTRIP